MIYFKHKGGEEKKGLLLRKGPPRRVTSLKTPRNEKKEGRLFCSLGKGGAFSLHAPPEIVSSGNFATKGGGKRKGGKSYYSAQSPEGNLILLWKSVFSYASEKKKKIPTRGGRGKEKTQPLRKEGEQPR